MTYRDDPLDRLVVRPRLDMDLDTCVRMLRCVHETHAYPINWPDCPRSWLTEPDGPAWVAHLDGALVGHVGVAHFDHAALIERLFIDPARAGLGIGRILLRRAVATARERSYEVLLDVVAADDAANAVYRCEGWREVMRYPITWGPEATSMVIRYRAPDASRDT